MDRQSISTEISNMAAKMSPPAAVTGTMIVGIPVDEWIKWGTLLYLACMITHFVWKWWREIKAARQQDAEEAAKKSRKNK